MNRKIKNKGLTKYMLVILFSVFFLANCKENDKDTEEQPVNESFSFIDKSFNMDECEIINYGKIDGLYTFEVNLKNKNGIQIYIKLFSIVKNVYDGYTYTLGSASMEYSSESHIKIGSDTYLLSEGLIELYDNVITHTQNGNFIFRINCNTTSGNVIKGNFEGTYKYIDKSTNDSSIPIGNGFFSYLDKSYLLTNGSLFYKGFDEKEKMRVYELFLTNEEEDYLQFAIHSESVLGIDLYKYYYNYPEELKYFFAPYPQSWFMYYGNRKECVYINEGWIGIGKSNNNYHIDVQCGYNIYQYFPIVGAYEGGLYFHDLSTDLINYKQKSYQAKSLELSYEGAYQNLFQYNLLIKTEQNDEINIRLFTNDNQLNGYYAFDKIIRKEIIHDVYESFINIKDKPLGFYYTGEMTIDASVPYINIDIIGMDEEKNIINIIYHGKINIQK
ncbi:MAG: hypothetical protein LBU51_10855 [Bacteroidales bacterium]|jgi:hypothetical protein|nr:hypothetical protein [Bacteroidales bacterium]